MSKRYGEGRERRFNYTVQVILWEEAEKARSPSSAIFRYRHELSLDEELEQGTKGTHS
jgi:hypothetical protein